MLLTISRCIVEYFGNLRRIIKLSYILMIICSDSVCISVNLRCRSTVRCAYWLKFENTEPCFYLNVILTGDCLTRENEVARFETRRIVAFLVQYLQIRLFVVNLLQNLCIESHNSQNTLKSHTQNIISYCTCTVCFHDCRYFPKSLMIV